MNTFKLALASWLSFAYPFFLFAATFIPPDSTSNFKFYADSTNCQAVVNVPLILDSNCLLENYVQSLQIDLDIQDLDQDGQFTVTDIVSDIADPSDYIKREEGVTFLTGDFPIGEHALLLPSMTACHDSVQLLFFSVMDTIAPKPMCKLYIEVQMEDVGEADLNQDGQIDFAAASIPVIDMLEELSTDCTGQLPPDGQPRRIVTDYSANWSGDPIDRSIDTFILTCPGAWTIHNFPEIKVNAWDEQGNYNSCSTRLYVTGPVFENRCIYEPPNLSIEISTVHGHAVPYVDIQMQGDLDTVLTTDENGLLFRQRSELDSLTISPRKDTNPAQGLSSFDITLLRRHILEANVLDSPYKLLAADVNKDGKLSVRDIIELQRIILGIQDEFINNTSWRFFDRNFVFMNPKSPWEEAWQAESKSFNVSFGDVHVDFYGIKVGDLNNNVF